MALLGKAAMLLSFDIAPEAIVEHESARHFANTCRSPQITKPIVNIDDLDLQPRSGAFAVREHMVRQCIKHG